MKVKVKYLGNFHLLTQKSEEEIEIEGETKLYKLLEKLNQQYGEKFSSLISNPTTLIWVNKKPLAGEVLLKGSENIVLSDGCNLLFASLVGGG
jgi:molybdopterin converting factor small subunit